MNTNQNPSARDVGLPKVSVIMPAFNREKYIAESVKSALGQTFSDFELIIVDDGSTDKTLEIAKKFEADPRVHIVRNEKNLGIASTRNKALSLARGRYVAPLDSDDVWLDKDKLRKQTDFLDTHPEYAMVGGAIMHIDTQSRPIKKTAFACSDRAIRNKILQSNQFAQSALMYRKGAVMACGAYDRSFQVCDDLNLWLCVGAKHSLENLPDTLTGYRIHGGNITRTKRLTSAREILEIVRAHRAEYPHASLGVAKAYLRLILAYVRT